jgi:N-acetyl-beta-hexosaminidase
MSYTISVTEISSLTIARRLKMVVERLFKQTVSITQHEVGDLHLVQQANASVIYKDRGIKVVADKNELLAVASHALIQEFLGELPLGETVVTYQQEQRILMIDMARKYFSKEILLQFIDSKAFVLNQK